MFKLLFFLMWFHNNLFEIKMYKNTKYQNITIEYSLKTFLVV